MRLRSSSAWDREWLGLSGVREKHPDGGLLSSVRQVRNKGLFHFLRHLDFLFNMGNLRFRPFANVVTRRGVLLS